MLPAANTSIMIRMTTLLMVILCFSINLAQAQVVSLILDSEPGDPVGQGQHHEFDQDDGSTIASVNMFQGITVIFTTDTMNIRMSFAPREGAPFIPGPYEGARRYPFQSPTGPGLTIVSNAVCGTLYGRFDVYEVELGAQNQILRFSVDFEQHCNSPDTPPLRGQLRINASPQPFPAPPDQDQDGVPDTIDNCIVTPNASQFDRDRDLAGDSCDAVFNDTRIILASEAGDIIGGGIPFELYPDQGRVTANREVDNAITIEHRSQSSWLLQFAAADGADLSVGHYANARLYPTQQAGEPGLNISRFGTECSSLFGSFDVHEVEYNNSGEVLRFFASFEQRCDDPNGPALRGDVRYNASTDELFFASFE